MPRFLVAIFTMSILIAHVYAQSPASTSPSSAASPPSRVPLKSPVSPSPSATPSTKDVTDSLGPVDLQAVVSLLKSNFVNPDAVTETELSRATVQGLMVRLPHGVTLLPNKESAPVEAPSSFYSEILGGHIGYLRLGSLNGVNLQALDRTLSTFAGKKVDALIVDLRSSNGVNDLAVAADFAKRFCPKGKTLFTLRKPTARQHRLFSSERDPAFQGLMMVLTDPDTSGGAEALAAALRFHDKALLIGQPTGGRAAEYSDLQLPGGKILRVAVAEMVSPDGHSLFPEGLKPDLPVEMAITDKHQIFQMSAEKSMAPFVYETGRPHLNEASLLAGVNPEVEAAEAAQQRRGRGPEKPPAYDPVLQRALDVVTSLEVYQKR